MSVLENDTTPTTGTDEPRLALRKGPPGHGEIDGGWWPRSMTPDQLQALAAAAEPTFGPVIRIAVNLQSWAGTPRRLGTRNDALRVDTFRSWDPATVRLVGRRGDVLDLLVVPPDTDAATAAAALAAASDPTDPRRATDILKAAAA